MCQKNMTYHASFERVNRIEYILDTVGVGEEVARVWDETRQTFQCLTDTGVVIVVNEKGKIVTMFIATTARACAIYKACTKASRVPNYLFKIISRNQYYMERQPK